MANAGEPRARRSDRHHASRVAETSMVGLEAGRIERRAHRLTRARRTPAYRRRPKLSIRRRTGQGRRRRSRTHASGLGCRDSRWASRAGRRCLARVNRPPAGLHSTRSQVEDRVQRGRSTREALHAVARPAEPRAAQRPRNSVANFRGDKIRFGQIIFVGWTVSAAAVVFAIAWVERAQPADERLGRRRAAAEASPVAVGVEPERE